MPLIVETGTGADATANSYVTRADIVEYAAARGVIIPNDATTDVCAIKAMDYLEVQTYKGEPVAEGVQPLPWPRNNVIISSTLTIAADSIPQALKNAQCELAMQSFNGIDLLPSRAADQHIKSETIGGTQGQIVTEYFGPAPVVPLLARAEALLRPLLSVGFNDIRVVRA